MTVLNGGVRHHTTTPHETGNKMNRKRGRVESGEFSSWPDTGKCYDNTSSTLILTSLGPSMPFSSVAPLKSRILTSFCVVFPVPHTRFSFPFFFEAASSDSFLFPKQNR